MVVSLPLGVDSHHPFNLGNVPFGIFSTRDNVRSHHGGTSKDVESRLLVDSLFLDRRL